MAEYTDEDMRGSRFVRVDLSRSHLHGVFLQDVRITDAWVQDVQIDGHLVSLRVNGVEVRDFVESELDRRHPERPMLRAGDPAGLRAAWTMVLDRADATAARARALPLAALDESVDGEWSYLQTLRHLVFAIDRWITGPVLAEAHPFHPLGYQSDDPEAGRAIGLDVDAQPSLDEVLAVRRDRTDRLTDLLREIDDAELDRTVASPNGGKTTVRHCVHVVLREEWAHDTYANRDLGVLAGRPPAH